MTVARTNLDLIADEIIAKYDAGRSKLSLAEEYGCAPATLKKLFVSRGIAVRAQERWSDSEAAIVEAYARLGTAREVAAEIGCSSSAVLRYLQRQGVAANPRRPKARFAPAAEQAIAAAYATGERSKALAARYDTTVPTVLRIVKRQGGTVRQHGALKAPLDEPTIDAIEELYWEMRTKALVARELGITEAKVGAALRSRGIDARSVRRRGANHPMWKGGRTRTGDGYWRIQLAIDDPFISMADQKGYVLEHRYVMAQSLGRVLDEAETVHHIDDDHGHNERSNLQLRDGRHGKGASAYCAECGSLNIAFRPIEDPEPALRLVAES